MPQVGQAFNNAAVALQFETYVPGVSLMFGRPNMFWSKLNTNGERVTVSTRDLRIILEMEAAGNPGVADLDGGSIGPGTGGKYEVATLTPIYLKMNFQWTDLTALATESKEKAQESFATRILKSAIPQFRNYLDRVSQTAGDGTIGVISSYSGTGNLTWAMGYPFGARLCSKNEVYPVYDSTGTVQRGTVKAITVDRINNILTVDNLPLGTIATDIIKYSGLVGSNPIGIFGIPYHQNNSQVGVWQNLNRSTYPIELATPYVNANNSGIVASFFYAARNRRAQAMGLEDADEESMKGQFFYTALEQEQALAQLGVNATQVIMAGGASKPDDFDPVIKGPRQFGGYDVESSVNAAITRGDFLDLSKFGRGEIQKLDFVRKGGHNVFWTTGADGTPNFDNLFSLIIGMQIFNTAPRAGSYIGNLGVPAIS